MRKPSIRRNLTKISGALALSGALFVFAGWISASDQREAILQARADRLYAYDYREPNKLPANALRALSIALAFHDIGGAEQLIANLESIRR